MLKSTLKNSAWGFDWLTCCILIILQLFDPVPKDSNLIIFHSYSNKEVMNWFWKAGTHWIKIIFHSLKETSVCKPTLEQDSLCGKVTVFCCSSESLCVWKWDFYHTNAGFHCTRSSYRKGVCREFISFCSLSTQNCEVGFSSRRFNSTKFCSSFFGLFSKLATWTKSFTLLTERPLGSIRYQVSFRGGGINQEDAGSGLVVLTCEWDPS